MDAEEGPFRPPEHLLKASQARQAKIKQMQDGRLEQQQQGSDPNLLRSGNNTPPSRRSSSNNLVAQQQQQQQQQPSGTATPPTNESGNNSPSAHRRSSMPASRAAQEVETIRQAREERRAMQAEMRKMRQGMDSSEHDTLAYRQMIERFRESQTAKWQQIVEEQQDLPAVDDAADRAAPPGGPDDNVIRVCVRKRPMNSRESEQFDVISSAPGVTTYPQAEIFVHEPKRSLDLTKSVDTHQFLFDNVFDESCDNLAVYRSAVKPLVSTLFEPNGRATFFAYGQTGSGKTFTVFGSPLSVPEPKRALGIFEYAGRDIFERLKKHNMHALSEGLPTLEVSIGFFEIYGGRIFDLFNQRQRITLLENAKGQLHIGGIQEVPVQDGKQMMQWLDVGEKARSTGATDANPESSRSHAIFQISLRQVSKNGVPQQGIHGQLSFIDLAGSERASEANASNRQTRIEGAEINKSLLALKECIRALNKPNSKHVPFRASKLTQVLRDSLQSNSTPSTASTGGNGGGSSRRGSGQERNRAVVMMATISPNSVSVEHTLNTLRYANRVKEFKGGARGEGNVVAGKMVYDPYEMVRPPSAENLVESSAKVAQQQQQPVAKPANSPAQQQRMTPSPQPPRSYQSSPQPARSYGGSPSPQPPKSMQSSPAPRGPTNGSPQGSSPAAAISKPTTSSGHKVFNSSAQRAKSRMGASRTSNSSNSSLPRSRQGSRDGSVGSFVHEEMQELKVTSGEERAPPSAARARKVQRQPSTVQQYHQAVQSVLDEEEQLINAHFLALRRTLEICRLEEQELLGKVSRPGYDLDEYVSKLEAALEEKARLIGKVQGMVDKLKRRLREEEMAAQGLQDTQEQLDLMDRDDAGAAPGQEEADLELEEDGAYFEEY